MYFDTNVLRYFSTVFNEKELATELRAEIVLSPVSALELMSQLCYDSAAQAFAAVQAMWNWLPEQVSVLDIAPIFVRLSVTGRAEDGQSIFERLTNSLTQCLHAQSAEDLREASKELRSYLGRAKLADAQTRMNAVLSMRQSLRRASRKTISNQELRDAFLNSIAIRAEVDSGHPGVASFASKVEAYYQHETVRLRRAIENPKMNLVSKKRQNDLFDSEQLLYLAIPDLSFLTTDGRAYAHLASLEQGKRIHIVRPESLRCFNDTHQLLRRAIAA